MKRSFLIPLYGHLLLGNHPWESERKKTDTYSHEFGFKCSTVDGMRCVVDISGNRSNSFFFAAIEQNARDSWRYCSAGSTTVNTSEFLFWLIFPMQSSCQKMKECLITATDNIPDSYYAWHPKSL